MKTKKISKLYFKQFCDSFKEWQLKLGLTQYDVFFHQKHLLGSFAEMNIKELAKVVSVTLTTVIEYPETDPGPESHAKHEAIHMLLNRLSWLGDSRIIEQSDIEEECEALVRRLEKLL